MFKNMDYVMVMVSNMDQSVIFYKDKLGISLRFSTGFWTEFDMGNTTLALHGGAASKKGEEIGDAGNCSFGFYVDNIDDVYKKLTAKRIEFIQKPDIFRAFLLL